MNLVRFVSFGFMLVFIQAYAYSNSGINFKDKKNTLLKSSLLQKLRPHLNNKKYIFLGENHETMTDRQITNEIIQFILNLQPAENNTCLFLEVPSTYNKFLNLYKKNELKLADLKELIPKNYFKMLSTQTLLLFKNNILQLIFMDLKNNTNMNERNNYMYEYSNNLINKLKCNSNIFINGSRHLFNFMNYQREQIYSLPSFFNNRSLSKIVFIPSNCQQTEYEVHNKIPKFFEDLLNLPRQLEFYPGWYEFDAYVVYPYDTKCLNNPI